MRARDLFSFGVGAVRNGDGHVAFPWRQFRGHFKAILIRAPSAGATESRRASRT